MYKTKLFSILPALTLCLTIISCAPSIKTTGFWVNRDKIPAEPIKSVFIIAFTDNAALRVTLEKDLAAAAEKKGIKAYKSVDIIGVVDMKLIAPVKDVFIKKLQDLNCETIFTIALVNEISETRYVPESSNVYSPYSYGAYGGYGGYGAYGAYGGFGGYYGFAISTMSTPGYYTTDSKYFIEAKLFNLETDETLLSLQTKADNPSDIEKFSKQYTETLMNEINSMGLRKK